MSETITFVTCGSAAEAGRIAAALVGGRLAACVTIVPGVTSVYRWKGKVARGREWLLLVKSRAALAPKLRRRVRELHSYSVPEIVSVRIASGDADYLRWIRHST